MKNKVELLLEDLDNFMAKTGSLSLEINVKNRLEKNLSLYLSELKNSEERLKAKKTSTVFKELSR